MSSNAKRWITYGMEAVAAVALLFSIWQLAINERGITREAADIKGIPATIYRSADAKPAPVIVIAHGFAGSQQIMQSFAITLARNGYIAVTFDFAGHGRNPNPLTGSITEETGATHTLVNETASVSAFARTLGDGRIAILGHSMASDIIVRYASAHPEVAATVAVSMFSPAVTKDQPKNLLVIVGDWEQALKTEALRAVALSTGDDTAEPGRTYGDFGTGNARRAVFIPRTEHVSVLFRQESMRESRVVRPHFCARAQRPANRR